VIGINIVWLDFGVSGLLKCLVRGIVLYIELGRVRELETDVDKLGACASAWNDWVRARINRGDELNEAKCILH